MSDKTQFYRITKPLSFRGIRLLKTRIYNWWRFKFLYQYNLFLKKIGKRKRHKFSDTHTEYPKFDVKTLIGRSDYKVITTPLLRCTVRAEIEEIIVTDEDYFYKIDKRGNKKITYTVTDNHSSTIYLRVRLTQIAIQFDPSLGYRDVDTIELKVAYRDVTGDFNTPSVTKRIDISKIKDLQYCTQLDAQSLEYIKIHSIRFLYEKSVAAFQDHLNKITLKDLIVED